MAVVLGVMCHASQDLVWNEVNGGQLDFLFPLTIAARNLQYPGGGGGVGGVGLVCFFPGPTYKKLFKQEGDYHICMYRYVCVYIYI